jgi:hypothetical protein
METTTITHRTARINRAGKRHEYRMLLLPSPALHITSRHIYPATIANASLPLIYQLSSQSNTGSYTSISSFNLCSPLVSTRSTNTALPRFNSFATSKRHPSIQHKPKPKQAHPIHEVLHSTHIITSVLVRVGSEPRLYRSLLLS